METAAPIQLRLIPDFCEEDHSYRFNDWILPGVSGLLEKTGIKEPFDRTFWRQSLLKKGMSIYEAEEFMDLRGKQGRDRGSLVHALIEGKTTGKPTPITSEKLEAAAVTLQQVEGYMASYRRFCEAWGFGEVLLQEQPLVHPTGHYCGTADCVAIIGGHPTILDWKTIGPDSKKKPKPEKWQLFQLTAYLAAINACSDAPPVVRAMNVYLKPEGFHCHPWTEDEIYGALATLKGLIRDFWQERFDLGEDWHQPDLAAQALSAVNTVWGPWDDDIDQPPTVLMPD